MGYEQYENIQTYDPYSAEEGPPPIGRPIRIGNLDAETLRNANVTQQHVTYTLEHASQSEVFTQAVQNIIDGPVTPQKGIYATYAANGIYAWSEAINGSHDTMKVLLEKVGYVESAYTDFRLLWYDQKHAGVREPLIKISGDTVKDVKRTIDSLQNVRGLDGLSTELSIYDQEMEPGEWPHGTFAEMRAYIETQAG